MYIQTFELKYKIKLENGKTKTYKAIINCWSEGTSYGFRHLASLGYKTFKMCYYNRTWERFQYESVLLKVLHYISDDNNIKIRNFHKYLDKNLKKLN